MKRTVIAAVGTALLASLSLSACSTNSGNNIELTVWTSQEDQKDQDAWLQTMQAWFEEDHPELNITWHNSVVSPDTAADTVGQDPAAAADVYQFASDQLGTLMSAGAVGQAKVSFPLWNSWYIPAFYAATGTTFFGEGGLDENAGIQAGDKAVDVTKYLVKLVNNPNFINDNDGAGLGSLGKGVDVVFSGAWDAENAKKALGDNLGVAMVPMFNIDGQDTQMKAFAGAKAVAYNPHTKYPRESAMFAEFLASAESQKVHYEKNGVIPADKNLASDEKISADPVAIALIKTVTNGSILQPTIKKMTDFWDPAENFGRALLNREVTEENAAEKTDAWFKAYK